MKEKLFTISADEKQLLQKISSLCGIKQEIIKEIWQFTLFTSFIDILENKDKSYNIIQIPFLGKILIKPDKEKPGEYENFFILNEDTKNIVKKIKSGSETELIKYFQDNFINKVLNNIDTKEE
jgi:agmatine/peptidylarginine deiminase